MYVCAVVKSDRPLDAVTPLLASTLRAESARRRIRQTDVAEAIGRTQSYVSYRWNGLASLTVDELARWSVLLDMRPEVLLADALADWAMPRPVRKRSQRLRAMSDPVPSLMAVADDQDEEIGSDPDSGYDNA